MSRAYTIQQSQRALQKAKRITKIWFPGNPEQAEKTARHIQKNRTQCSCLMCRNPRTSKCIRAHRKLTLAETRQTQRSRY